MISHTYYGTKCFSLSAFPENVSSLRVAIMGLVITLLLLGLLLCCIDKQGQMIKDMKENSFSCTCLLTYLLTYMLFKYTLLYYGSHHHEIKS